MKSFRAITSFCVVLQIALCAHGQSLTSTTNLGSHLQKGLVVEQVSKNTQAQRAGMRPGDILLSWRRADEHGEFESPFDLAHVFLEQASRGPVIVSALRGGQRREWLFCSDAWGVSVRPNFSEQLLSIYRQSEASFAAGNLAEATDGIRAVAANVREGGPLWLGPWFLSHAGKILLGARQWELADIFFQEAIAQAPNAGPVLKAELFRQRAAGLAIHQDLAGATKYYQDVLLESQKWGRKTMVEANALLSLAVIELKRGDFESAEEHLRHAVAIGEVLAPTSIQTLLTIANLAVLYQDQGEFEKAEQYYLKALDREKNTSQRAPTSPAR